MNSNGSADTADFASMTDEELVALAKQGNSQAVSRLISEYLTNIRKRAESFSGVACDDLVQEGLMGLLNGIYTFDSEKGIKFYTYAMTCAKNRMITAYKKLDISGGEFSEDEEDFSANSDEIPENVLIEKERLEELTGRINSALTELELNVFKRYITGMSYTAIAECLGTSVKAVNNAMQRARKKLKAVLRQEN